MAQTGPPAPRRRFAPVPIETTFQSVRKGGPAAELTPDPSPRSPSPPPRSRGFEQPDRRRFAPQFVESTRRSRKLGDIGPATKPADKTDITPYTNHIYAHRAKRRHRPIESQARRESCDDLVSGHVWDLSARDAERKRLELEEVALSAFPNSGVRIGGAEHFFVREGSASEDEGPEELRGRAQVRFADLRPSRRDSSEEDVGWAVREMQEHHEQLTKTRGDRISTLDLDKMDIDSPPGDALWMTKRKSTDDAIQPIGETFMPFIPSEPLAPIRESETTSYGLPDSPKVCPIGETFMPYIPSAPPGEAASMPYIAASSRIPPESGFNSHRGVFRAPFGGWHTPIPEESDKKPSPPMLGKDLTFRMCPSPKATKLEPDHLWLPDGHPDEANRDKTGQHGLWQGYCYTPHLQEALVPMERPAMIQTPLPSSSSTDPFAAEFGSSCSASLSEEPSPLTTASSLSTSEHRPRNGEAKGLHMLMGLDERLAKEKAAADRDDAILAEFDPAFVTQVFNYLSLGYPSMARAYDDELSKISRIGVEELRRGDDGDDEGGGVGAGRAMGYIMRDVDGGGGDGAKDEERGPRWTALRQYIYEWARQHPDLDGLSPLGWGVMERRGSWGI